MLYPLSSRTPLLLRLRERYTNDPEPIGGHRVARYTWRNKQRTKAPAVYDDKQKQLIARGNFLKITALVMLAIQHVCLPVCVWFSSSSFRRIKFIFRVRAFRRSFVYYSRPRFPRRRGVRIFYQSFTSGRRRNRLGLQLTETPSFVYDMRT